MLKLSDELLIGKGANRTCYRHSMDNNKCIKIPLNGKAQSQTLECQYYEVLQSKINSWKHISRYYGVFDTNLGKGYVYQLIRDYDQAISLPLSEYLSEIPVHYIDDEVIHQALAELKDYLLTNNIIIRNLRAYNILFKRTGPEDGIAIIIDNLGHHNNRFHLTDKIAYFARKDIESKWKRFEKRLNVSNRD